MLHNVFDCNLLLVNLQDMFSNVNESRACRGRVYTGTKRPPGNNKLGTLFIGSEDTLTPTPCGSYLAPVLLAFILLIELVIKYSSFVILNFSKCCLALTN